MEPFKNVTRRYTAFCIAHDCLPFEKPNYEFMAWVQSQRLIFNQANKRPKRGFHSSEYLPFSSLENQAFDDWVMHRAVFKISEEPVKVLEVKANVR